MKMKKFCMALMMLILCVALVGCAGGVVGYNYENADRYRAGGASVSGRVTELDVSWLSGEVTVAYHDGKDVLLSESANRTMKEEEQLHWWLDDGTLYVKYAASGLREMKRLDKRLTVLLPEGMQLSGAKINSVSADVEVMGLCADTIRLNTVSGGAVISANGAEQIIIDTVSGNVQAEAGAADTIRLNTVSGDAVIGVEAADQITIDSVSGDVRVNARKANAIKADSTSGKVHICLPEGTGFTAKVDTVSGSVKGNMPMQREGKNTYTNGDGSCRITVDTVSGNVQLDKLSH